MCSNIKVIKKTENGLVFRCNGCESYQILFNNLSFSFTDKEYFHFSNYVLTIDAEYFKFNDDCLASFNKKIPLPIGHKNFMVMLDFDELDEFKALFSHSKLPKYSAIGLDKINYKLFMN